MKPWIKIILGLSIALGTIAFIVIWDLYVKDEIVSANIVVIHPTAQVEAKEMIQREHLLIESRQRSSLVNNAVLADDIDQVTGRDAAVRLVGNAILSMDHIDFDNMIPDPKKGEAIRPVPDEWIYAKPGSLRRKDKIDIYVINANTFTTNDERVQPSSEEHREELQEELNVEMIIDPILTGVPVIYAKDSSNREVVGQNTDGRLDATGNISDLELNLNDQDFAKLMGYIQQGYRLYITYH